jgi:hypothetical protein
LTYVAFVGFEVDRKKLHEKGSVSNAWAKADSVADVASITASRLIGVSLERSPVVKTVLELQKIPVARNPVSYVVGAKLFLLRNANPVLVLWMEFNGSHKPKQGLQRLSVIDIQKIMEAVGLDDCIDISTSVYSIVGSIAADGDPWLPLTKDGWLHIHGTFMDRKVVQQIVTQVAIERSILNFSLLKRRWPGSWFAAPFAGRLIRSWPVEFLADKQSISENYHNLRKSLNIPTVRAELLDKSKQWWTVVSSGAAIVAFFITLLALVI